MATSRSSLDEQQGKKNPRLLRDLEREPQVLILFLVVTAGLAVLANAGRQLWFDELYTFYLSQLPLGAIWPALRHGADLNPPVMYWLTHASFAVFGVKELPARLPAIAGFLVMTASLCWFVRRRSTIHYGIAALTFPLLCPAYRYITEARPYGLLLGFSGIALVAWQYAAEGKRRRIALPVLLLALSAAVMTHYYGVFLIGAIGLGELVRLRNRRRIDWPAALCLGAPLLFVAGNLLSTAGPMLTARQGIRGIHFLSAHWGSIPNFYDELLTPLFWPLVGALLIVILMRDREAAPGSPNVPAYEWTCLVALILVPVLICVSAIIRHDIFVLRHGLLGLLGIDAAIVLLVFRGTRGSATAGVALSLLFVGVFTLSWTAQIVSALADGGPKKAEISPYAEAPANLPLVISNGLLYIQAQQYQSKAVTDHLYFVTDPEIALRETGTIIFDAGFYGLEHWHGLRGTLMDYRTFLASHPHFFVYGPDHYPEDWLIPQLLKDSCNLRLVSQHESEYGAAALLDVQCR